MSFEKLVLVTRKTRLEELICRFNTRSQAQFYIEHAGGDFAEYEREDAAYRRALDDVRGALSGLLKLQILDRDLSPTFLFSPQDLVVTLGQDGLVANTAKYALGQPIIAINPDDERFDGVLLPFTPGQARAAVTRVLRGQHRVRAVTLAEVCLQDGQRLLAFNDLYIGARTHVSARYHIRFRNQSEPHSSSGVIVSTGAGSTGWLSSVFNMASGVLSLLSGSVDASPSSPAAPAPGPRPSTVHAPRMAWEDPRLLFVVREPFISRHSRAGLVTGLVQPGEDLRIESAMPQNGVIFSDGVEADYLHFNSGAIAHIRAAAQTAQLVIA